MAQIEVSALDPMDAFTTTLRDLIQITEVFKKNDAIPPIDYLRALHHARETLEAINYAVIASMQIQVVGRVPQEVRDAHLVEIEAEHFARIDDDDDAQIKRIQRLLEPFSLNLDLDTDNLPPGFPRPDDN